MIITAGAVNKSVYYYIVGDASHASPGDPITGLLYSDIETGGSASYMRQGAARVDLTLITLASASAAHADGGFIEVDATNMPGVYRCDYPDAAWSPGVDQVVCHLVAASANNAAIAPVLVDITDFDTRSSTVTVGTNNDKSGYSISGTKTTLDALNDIAATAVVSGGAINTTTGAVDNVTTVATTTTNTDMRGTDSAATAAALATVDANVDAILVDTADMQPRVAAIETDTSTTLDNHLTDIKGTGFVKDTHSLVDIEAYVDLIDDGTSGLAKIAADVAAILVDTNELQTDDVPGLIAALNDISTANVLTQVNAALDTAIAELGVATPTATPTLRTGLMLLYMALRNKTVVQTSGTDALEIYNDAGTKIASKLLSDDGSDYTEAEMT